VKGCGVSVDGEGDAVESTVDQGSKVGGVGESTSIGHEVDGAKTSFSCPGHEQRKVRTERGLTAGEQNLVGVMVAEDHASNDIATHSGAVEATPFAAVLHAEQTVVVACVADEELKHSQRGSCDG